MNKPSKGWPRLDLYIATRKVGGSRRRGRNAVNMWAADTLYRSQIHIWDMHVYGSGIKMPR